jgi:tRNA(Arg) A34 adenosine deaminase TadA
MPPAPLELRLPDWTNEYTRANTPLRGDADRMRFAIALAAENVRQGTGGPFGAAVFERASGQLVAIGVNLVPSLAQSMLHAEVVAIMFAQHRVGSYTLATPGTEHDLFTSCEPCAMCLGAVLWSGVRRLVCGATREDAEAIGFDEGPVYEDSYEHLERRGIEVSRNIERAAARDVLQRYAAANGAIYNA